MANTGYPRQQQSSITDGGPGWMLICLIMILAVGLAALPWIIIGFIAQRILYNRQLHWRISFLIWFLLLIAGSFLIFNSYLHGGLELRFQNELTDYLLAAKHYQYDLASWPLRQLWSETWQVWQRTWPAIGIAGLVAEITTSNTTTVRTLRQNERRRQRRAQRLLNRARKRTSRPTFVPDEINGHMVIGIPIEDDNNEENE